MSDPTLILAIGELLWDMLPAGPQIGGAAANYAVMAARLGNHSAILSRVGRDDLGRRAVEVLEETPADISHIQIDPRHPTSTVTVELQHGQPSYLIHQPVAWDFLEDTTEWQHLASRASAVWFGTLAQRSHISRDTIQSLLAATFPECVRIFDVNLREPFYTAEILEESVEFATIIKMNEQELPKVLDLLGLQCVSGKDTDSLLEGAKILLDEFPLNLVAVTRGQHGSVLATREAQHVHPGVTAKIVDTIGAGDAFAAALTHYYLKGAPLAVLNEAGNRWGSWIASQRGAIPSLPEDVRNSMAAAIG
jgi:fructokinase